MKEYKGRFIDKQGNVCDKDANLQEITVGKHGLMSGGLILKFAIKNCYGEYDPELVKANARVSASDVDLTNIVYKTSVSAEPLIITQTSDSVIKQDTTATDILSMLSVIN